MKRESERARERELKAKANMERGEGSKILVIGGSGYIGKYMVKASVSLGHPTYVYSRQLTPHSSPSKRELIQQFQSIGVTIVYVRVYTHIYISRVQIRCHIFLSH